MHHHYGPPFVIARPVEGLAQLQLLLGLALKRTPSLGQVISTIINLLNMEPEGFVERAGHK